MLVSKNALSVINLVPVKDETFRDGYAEPANGLESLLAAAVANYSEGVVPRHTNLGFLIFIKPSFSTTSAGIRIARLFPHFATFMMAPLDIHYRPDIISCVQ